MVKRITLAFSLFFALAAGSALADGGQGGGVQGPFATAVHAVGTITYKDASQQTWNWDRGKITALSATGETIKIAAKRVVKFRVVKALKDEVLGK